MLEVTIPTTRRGINLRPIHWAGIAAICGLALLIWCSLLVAISGAGADPASEPTSAEPSRPAPTTPPPTRPATTPPPTTPAPAATTSRPAAPRTTTKAPARPPSRPRTTPPREEPDAYYANCAEARAAGAAPLYRGEPGYRSGLDRDGDGVACET